MKKTVFYVGPVGWGKKCTPYNSHQEACEALEEKERRGGYYNHQTEIVQAEVEIEEKESLVVYVDRKLREERKRR